MFLEVGVREEELREAELREAEPREEELLPVPEPERPEEAADVLFFDPPGSRAVDVGCLFPEELFRVPEELVFFCAILSNLLPYLRMPQEDRPDPRISAATSEISKTLRQHCYCPGGEVSEAVTFSPAGSPAADLRSDPTLFP